MNFDASAEWDIIRPGLIRLPTTDYEIEHGSGTLTYVVRWRGVAIFETQTLPFAKSQVKQHMRDMLDMGYEP